MTESICRTNRHSASYQSAAYFFVCLNLRYHWKNSTLIVLQKQEANLQRNKIFLSNGIARLAKANYLAKQPYCVYAGDVWEDGGGWRSDRHSGQRQGPDPPSLRGVHDRYGLRRVRQQQSQPQVTSCRRESSVFQWPCLAGSGRVKMGLDPNLTTEWRCWLSSVGFLPNMSTSHDSGSWFER